MLDPIGDVFDLAGYFTDVALGDPLSAVLLLVGLVFLVVPSLVFGVLALLGVIDWLVPAPAPSTSRRD